MARNFDRWVEQQIKKAEAEGKLKGLAGEGDPLPEHPENAYVNAGEAVGYRIMAEAGVLPEEIVLNKELKAANEAYLAAKGTDGEKAAMAKIADLQMRLNIAKDARRKFMKT